MAPTKKQRKPRCGKGQSCGWGCIEARDTCRETIDADVAARLVAVATAERQPSDAQGRSYDEVAKQFPPRLLAAAHAAGVQTEDLGSGVTLTRKTAVGLDGSSIRYSFVTDSDGRRYTISDGLIKEVTSGDKGAEWNEAFQAAVRSKVASEPDVATSAARVTEVGHKVPYASNPVYTMSQLPDYVANEYDSSVAKVAKVVSELDSSLNEQQIEGLARSFKSWLGSGYTSMSPHTYRSDADNSDKSLQALSNAQKVLSMLPGHTVESLEQARGDKKAGAKLSSPKKGQPLNRWMQVDNDTVSRLASMYKTGEEVVEHGMFGTTHLPASEMATFSRSANVSYKVNAISDGTGRGKAADQFKTAAYEGEVLYQPGTRFRVDRVEADFLTAEQEAEWKQTGASGDSNAALDWYRKHQPNAAVYKSVNSGVTVSAAELDEALAAANNYAKGFLNPYLINNAVAGYSGKLDIADDLVWVASDKKYLHKSDKVSISAGGPQATLRIELTELPD